MQASGGTCTGENLISNYTETVLNKKDEPLWVRPFYLSALRNHLKQKMF